MQLTEARRAVAAAMSTATTLGLVVDDAIVLNDSNRLVLLLLPSDVVARVAPIAYQASGTYSQWGNYQARAETEVELVRLLAETVSPVAPLDPRVEPRVHVHDGFVIDLWTYFETVQSELAPNDYAHALARMHEGMRQIDVTTPHFMERVRETERWVASRDETPDLTDDDRRLLADTFESLSRSIARRDAAEQLLHGEPHQWNMLNTRDGPLFIDFENCCRGPVEYDLAWVPREVSERYQRADQDLIDDCRGIVAAIVATHRWSPDDQHPSGRESGVAFVNALRKGPPWPALEEVTW